MSDVSIGTVSSEVRLNLTKLESDVSEAKSALASLAASLTGAVETFSAKMTQDAQAAVARESRQAEQAVQRMAQQQKVAGEQALRQQKAELDRAEQQAKQAQERALAGARKIGTELQTIGAVALGALGMAVKVGSDFESKIIEVGNNTTMTTAEIGKMRDAVADLGRESGADLGQLAEGYMHIANFSFDAAQSTQILSAATRAAVATGSNASDTAEILAKTLHEFGMGATDAGRAMNVLHLAAALGNMTLQQFDQAAGTAFAWASNLGVSLVDVSAAMSALTRHGLDAAQSSTQLKDIFTHIISPSKGAREEIEKLSKSTGVDLVGDFSLAGLQSKGFAGVLDDLKRATAGHREEVLKLIPSMRGALGAYILTGTGVHDLKEITDKLTDAVKDKADPITEGYARTQATLKNETDRAKNSLILMATDITNSLMPAVKNMVGMIKDAADWFHNLSPAGKDAAIGIGVATTAMLVMTGTALKAVEAIAGLRTALLALGGAKGLLGAGGVAETGISGAMGALGPLGVGGLLLAGGMGLGNAMNNTVWSGVKEAQNKAFAEDLAAKEKGAGYLRQRVQFLQADLPNLERSLKDYEGVPTKIKQINARMAEERAEFNRLMSGAPGIADPAGHGKPPPVKTPPPGGGGGSGGGGGASDTKRNIQEILDEIYKLTHSGYEVEMREAWQKMNESIRDGVPALIARQLYTLQLADIEKHQAEERAKMGGTMAQAVRNMQAVQAIEAKRENDEITASIRQIVDAYSAEATELESVKQATDDLDNSMQRMLDTQLSDIVGMMEAQKIEADATAQYWKDQEDAQEAAFRARIEQSALAAKAEQDERNQTEQYRKDNPEVFKKPKTDLDKTLQQMGQSVQSILGGAFEKVFLGDTKNLFGDLLKSFEQMLAKMVADAVAAGIVRSLFGGGNFLTGFLGSLTGGFDDAGNDRTARHWGFDFASMFSQGMNDHSNSRMAAAAPGGYGGGDTYHITTNLHNPVVRQEADINRLADAVARQVRNGLPARPGTGNRR